jgi:UPF0176 protein
LNHRYKTSLLNCELIMTYAVAAFYKFVAVEDGPALRSQLAELCATHAIIGTILLAPEGINATIAAKPANLEAMLAILRSDPRFADLDIKHSTSQLPPFQRLKVKFKREIVTFGVPEANPAKRVGTYINASDWNALISDPKVVVIDTRNTYEVGVGTFPRAIDPGTQAFGEFPKFVEANRDALKNKKVAMFCTGGIRCEKASAYLMHAGFENVYHLEGGILKYLETVPHTQSLWHGECFVFDERVALQHGVVEGQTKLCATCGHPHAMGQPCKPCSNETAR